MTREGIALLAVLAITACASPPARPAAPSRSRAPDAEVSAALHGFLTAFENLDWEPFRASFTDDACVFHPSADAPERDCGRAAVEARFKKVFDAERREATAGPPYMHLLPEDLQITMFGDDLSLATFHLRNPKRFGRRSVLFRREGGAWKIVHLHASNISSDDRVRSK